MISTMIGSSRPHHLHGGPHPTAIGGKMIAVVAVIGEDTTGGVSAGGEHDAQRELLPVEKGLKSTGDLHRGTGCLIPAANSFEFRSMNLALNPCRKKRTCFVVLCRHAGACALTA